MDQQNQVQMPITTAPVTPKKNGPIIAILIIVVILVIAGLYLFAAKINTTDQTTPYEETAGTQSVQPVTSQSDDVQSLEADLDASAEGLDGQNF
jgi:uncharacterized protein YxeA